jgi:hypothetical protein
LLGSSELELFEPVQGAGVELFRADLRALMRPEREPELQM